MPDTSTPGTFEECADELNDFVNTLDRYPPVVLAFAMRAHLCGILQAIQIQGECSSAEIDNFLEEMAREVREGIET